MNIDRAPQGRRLKVIGIAAVVVAAGLAATNMIGSNAEATAPAMKPVSHVMTPWMANVAIEMPVNNAYALAIGTFTVTEGAGVLGCSSGRFLNDVRIGGGYTSTLTCEDGARSGTFEITFVPQPIVYTATPEIPEYFAGPWTIDNGTADFRMLQGEGEFVGSRPFEVLAVEKTLTGTVQFDGPA